MQIDALHATCILRESAALAQHFCFTTIVHGKVTYLVNNLTHLAQSIHDDSVLLSLHWNALTFGIVSDQQL